MRVLIADNFEPWGVEALRTIGCEATHEPALKGDALRDAIAKTRCAVLIVRSTRVNADALAASNELALVVRAGAGFNTIDVDAASRASILVANCPGKNAVAVAELTFALILALDRRIVDNVTALRNGQWNKKEFSQSRGLKGRTLGIIGLGGIGRAVAARARAFEMPVAAWSRSLTPEWAATHDIHACENPAEVASRSDILTVHLASTPETRNLINADVLGRLKPGDYVINTSREEIVDYAALEHAVIERGIRVGLDVYPEEPASGQGRFSPAILNAGGIAYGTHHIGASTDQAQRAIAQETVRIVQTYIETGRVIHSVNLRAASEATWCLTVRHLNRPGVLAHVLHALSHEGINVEEMDNVITRGGEAACAHIHLDGEPRKAVLQNIREGSADVLGLGVTPGRNS